MFYILIPDQMLLSVQGPSTHPLSRCPSPSDEIWLYWGTLQSFHRDEVTVTELITEKGEESDQLSC